MVVKNLIRFQKGIGLLEVLIALLITSIGLLGLAGLQVKATHSEIEAYQRSQALIILEDMVNRINSNRTFIGCYLTSNTTLPGTWAEDTVGYNLGCNTVSDNDLRYWNNMLLGASEKLGEDGPSVGAMINAVGCFDRPDISDTSLYRVSVAWQGLNEIASPNNSCGQNLGIFNPDSKRRVVSSLVRNTNWK